ncbi:MAG: hypothetical protein Q9178_002987 [Gyalolechia marmorata]
MTQSLANRNVFPQQGSVEWGRLLSSIVEVSVGMLSRYAAGGVDSYTAIVGQALCNNFTLAPLGRRHVEEALKGLTYFKSYEDVFWFGFGINHLVRSLVATEQGASCLALCGALSECYHGSVPAELMAEMARNSQAPDELRPSVLQWNALIKACAGVFSCTPFPTRIHYFMTLCPTYPVPLDADRLISSPESVAEALWSIGKISRGELASVTVIGRIEAAAYLAAIAEWFFDLSIEIRDEGETLLYSRTQHRTDHIQLSIVFQSQPATLPSSSVHSLPPLSLQTVDRTYVLRDCEDMLRHENGLHQIYRSGRIEWKHALSSAFGSDLKKLLTVPRAFGLALGNAARILRAIVDLEDDIPCEISKWNEVYCDSSHGEGFIENTISWFPELGGLRTYMEEGLRVSYAHAKTMYEANLSQIGLACLCSLCKDVWTDEEDDRYADYDDDRYCCVVIVDTIIDLARCLSITGLSENLNPTRRGFELFYNHHLNTRIKRSSLRDLYHGIGPILFSLRIQRSVDDNGDQTYMKSSFRILELFTGQNIEIARVQDATAMCDAGLCAHLNILRELSDSGQNLGRITIVPGRIEFKAKVYDHIGDSASNSFRFDDGTSLLNRRTRIDKILSSNYDHVTMLAKESVDQLTVWFALKDTTNPSAETMKVGPRSVATSLSEIRGLVVCKRRQCPTIQDMVLTDISATYQKVHIYGKDIDVFRSSKLSRFALCGSPNNIGAGRILLVDQECFSCSIKTILRLHNEIVSDNSDDRMVLVLGPSR